MQSVFLSVANEGAQSLCKIFQRVNEQNVRIGRMT